MKKLFAVALIGLVLPTLLAGAASTAESSDPVPRNTFVRSLAGGALAPEQPVFYDPASVTSPGWDAWTPVHAQGTGVHLIGGIGIVRAG